MSNYSRGIDAENRIKHKLMGKGWLVRQSPGSRGPFDLYALKSGRKLLVQVKSGSAYLNRVGKASLKRVAQKKHATALSIHVRGKRIKSKFV